IACVQSVLPGEPGLGARIGRVDAQVHHLRHVQAPVTHDTKPLLVPVRLRDDVDRHSDLERASELQRLEIASKRNAFAKLSQAIPCNCCEAEKGLSEAELLP